MKKLISHLSQFVNGPRLENFERVVGRRTRYLTVVLEDIYQSQNASAVLRTCDCMGIQDVHIIENRNEFQLIPEVVMGSSKWLDIYRYNDAEENTSSTIQKLKMEGYRIIATSPHKEDKDPDSLDIGKGKMAFLFGTELKGLSHTALDMADEYLRIPIAGFTESFNISVSAAITLHHITHRLRNSEVDWLLSEEERDFLMLQWLRKSIKRSELIEAEFLRNQYKTVK